jgi:hypothetical protein
MMQVSLVMMLPIRVQAVEIPDRRVVLPTYATRVAAVSAAFATEMD